jgi:hypothetical protein
MKTYCLLTAAVVAFAFISGCSGAQKAAAEAAVSAAESAFQPVAAEAQKYVPDQAKAVKDSIDQAKASLTNGDYAAALETAKGLPGKITALAEAVKAKKAELTAKWNDLTSKIPGLVSAVESQMATLKKSHKLPSGADGAFSGLKQAWDDASTTFKAGDFQGAIAKADATKTKLAEIQKMLNMKPAAS